MLFKNDIINYKPITKGDLMNFELTKYIPIIDFLAEVLGEHTEIVLQEIYKEETGYVSSIVYIKHNISGRKIGAPGTDFVAKIIKSQEFKTKDYVVNYTGRSAQGHLLRSSSMFLKDTEDNLIGMLCINIDDSQLVKMSSLFNMGLQMLEGYLVDNQKNIQDNARVHVQENMYLSPDTSLEDAIYEFTGNKNIILSQMSKKKRKQSFHTYMIMDFLNLKILSQKRQPFSLCQRLASTNISKR